MTDSTELDAKLRNAVDTVITHCSPEKKDVVLRDLMEAAMECLPPAGEESP